MMSFIDDLFASVSEEDENDKKLDALLASKLKVFNFTDLEIKQVRDIINIAQEDIELVKNSLSGVDVDSPNAEKIFSKAKNEILDIQSQMSKDIKSKISNIRHSKEEYKKEL